MAARTTTAAAPRARVPRPRHTATKPRATAPRPRRATAVVTTGATPPLRPMEAAAKKAMTLLHTATWCTSPTSPETRGRITGAADPGATATRRTSTTAQDRHRRLPAIGSPGGVLVFVSGTISTGPGEHALKFLVRNVKVTNVSLSATEQDIKEFFSFSGDIEYVDMQRWVCQ